MTLSRALIQSIVLSLVLALSANSQTVVHPWFEESTNEDREVVADIAAPAEFGLTKTADDSFANWLGQLPLKPESTRARLFDGRLKPYPAAVYRVVDIDVGERDLQQCADAVMRLRSEYFWHRTQYDSIAFNFTSGDRAKYVDWREGIRPKVNGNEVTWQKTAEADSSYKNFRKYLETVFMYAGTYSLAKEMKSVEHPEDVRIGDIFIRGGFPGHTVIVVGLASDSASGKKAILLAQGFTPAQDIHVLTNLNDGSMNPWYLVEPNNRLRTPEWTFDWSDLKRFE